MQQKQLSFSFTVFDNEQELSIEDTALMQQAKAALSNSYSPYSNYKVGCAILLENGKTVIGANQENAAYPMCVCAEVVTLNSCASHYPNMPIHKMAITVKSPTHIITHPAAPCGQCRQTILEYENRYNRNIELLLMGEEGAVYAVQSVKDLLPLHFSANDL